MSRRQIVLLGVGHTNAHIVREWKTKPIANADLVCVNPFPTATYSGMLPGALSGQFSDAEWRINLSALCQRADARLVLANTHGLDLRTGQLLFENHANIRFDALSIGIGSMPAGWEDHCDVSSVIAIKPMQTFLHRLDTRISDVANRHPGPMKVAIVGGGAASIEIALCLLRRCNEANRSQDVKLAVYTSDRRIGRGMSSRSVCKIEQLLAQCGIEVIADRRVCRVAENELETEDGLRYAADIVIWATGAAAPPVLGKLGLRTDDCGFIATSGTLQSLTDPRVFAVGDAGTVLESPSPKAGVYAVRQCPILSHNLRAFFAHQPLRRFNPQARFLKLLNTGDGKALLEYGRWSFHARWCWYLKACIDRRFVRQYQVHEAT